MPLPADPARSATPAPGGQPLPPPSDLLVTHLALLRRYMSSTSNGAEPAAPGAVEGGGLPEKAAEGSTPFLVDLGLLVEEAAGKFKPTPVAMQLINTLATSDDRGRRLLRSYLSKSWFARSALELLHSRPTASTTDLFVRWDATLEGEGARKSDLYPVLLEYLAYTGLVPDGRFGRAEARPTADARTVPPEGPAGLPPRVPSAASPDPLVSGGNVASDDEWETIETRDYRLRIRSDARAVARLRKQLDLLEESLSDPPRAKRRR